MSLPVGVPTSSMVIGLSDEEQVLIWVNLQEYRQRLEHQLQTKFDGDPKWSDEEDGTFLRHQMRLVDQVVAKMMAQGYRI